MTKPYYYTKSQIDKIGNTIIYFAGHIADLNKTKLIKLLYLTEQLSIQKYGFPLLNIRFDVWKFGPVPKDIYIELSEQPDLLKDYIDLTYQDSTTYVKPLKNFNDDEFSENELRILEYIANQFRDSTARELVALTHSEYSPWYLTAQKNGLLEHLSSGEMNSSDIEIDFTYLFEDEAQKMFYIENKDALAFSQHLKG